MTKVTSDPASVSTFIKRPNPSLMKAPSKTIAFVLPPSRMTTIAAPRRPGGDLRYQPVRNSLPRIAPIRRPDRGRDPLRLGWVTAFVRDIDAYLTGRNAAPKPYRWKAKGAAILAKINRARAALDNAKAVV